MNFYLPDTYYDPPEPTEQVIDVEPDELECGEFGEFDASMFDGEEWIVFCDKCDTNHSVTREIPEPDYDAMNDERREAAMEDYADRD